MKPYPVLPLFLALAACATAGKPSGQLSSYDGQTRREGALRTGLSERKATAAADGVRRIALEPTRIVGGDDWLSADERRQLTREADAQLCFELTERYELAASPQEADATFRALITRVKPTGRAGSTVSAASRFFIPGPVGVRVPGTLGGLGPEAEMVDRDGHQLAAIVWNRDATAVGTDSPSLSRLGDALQFIEPFADAAAAAATPPGRKSHKIAKEDPCAAYGRRMRPEGFLASAATGLYVPQFSAAKAEEKPSAAPR